MMIEWWMNMEWMMNEYVMNNEWMHDEWMNDANGFIDRMGSFTHYIMN